MATITSLAPSNQGKVGNSITINGTGFTGTARVNFGTAPVTPTSVTPTTVVFTVPSTAPCAGQVMVSVTSNAGATSNALPFFVIPAPSTTSLSVSCVPIDGDTVTLSGSNFLTATGVSVGGLPSVTPTGVSPTQATFAAPDRTGAGQTAPVDTLPVTITTAGGTSVLGTTQIDYYLAPTITLLTPDTGAEGDQILVDGTNFVNVGEVAFGGIPAVFTPYDTDQLVATVPAGLTPGAQNVTVTTCGGTSAPAAFTAL